MSNFIIDKSFQIIKTNPRLTTNIKINVDNDYNLYLESFNSNKQLSDDKYKHFSISEFSYYEDMIPRFYNKLPINLAFDVKDNKDKEIVYTTFLNQFDDLYWSGVKKVEQNKFYKEEFEYLAPLYMKYNDLPDNFIIMRVDDLGVYDSEDEYKISNTNPGNFNKEIIDKWKCVTDFDLSTKSKLGNWMDNNFINNDRFPIDSFEFDPISSNYSRWYGIDYKSGSFTERSMYITDKIWSEQPHFRLEEYITNGFRDNGIVFPNILNLNFLFDDDPATPYKYNKYSLNRYFGFYVDLEKVDSLTSYESFDLRLSSSTFAGLTILNNIFLEYGTDTISVSPFYATDKEWDDKKQYYIYVKDDLFEVKRSIVDDRYSYSIISKYDVKIEDINRSKEMDIIFEEDNFNYKNIIKMRNSVLNLDVIYTISGPEIMPGDLYLIEIDDKFHVLEFDEVNEEYLIRTDYAIKSDNKTLKYWVSSEDNSTTILTHDLINRDKPLVYDIFRVKFRDIKDFDFNRVDSGFADFDFDKENSEGYVDTTEQKLYCVEYRDASESTVFMKYPDDNIIIASSEYVSDDELYEVNKNGLTGIWDKNPSVPKWGYVGSISHSDYPYKLNNSNKVGFTFNRTTDTLSTTPDINTKTNDYFYRIGTFIDDSSTNYKYFKTQSLTIETDTNKELQFNLDYYLDSEIDYFDYFFNNNRKINSTDYIESQNYSIFNGGSKYNLSSTVFKGIKYEIDNIFNVIKKDSNIDYLSSYKDFNQYKFSVISNYHQTSNPEWDSIKTTKADFTKDGIHVFLNDKFKNILVIVNLELVLDDDGHFTINNLHYYDKDVIYNGSGINNPVTSINTTLATANIFISELEKNLIDYYYIDVDGQSGHTLNTTDNTQTSTMQHIDSWNNEFSPFKLQTLYINNMKIKKNSYNIAALRGPKTNIYDKFKTDFTEIPYDKSFIKNPLARIIELNEEELKPRAQVHGETLKYDKSIYRYKGSYEPIFKNISLFKTLDLNEKWEFFETRKNASYYNWDEENDFYVKNIIGNGYIIPVDVPLIVNDFKFNIPINSIIKGITVIINRTSSVGPDGSSTQTSYFSGISDHNIELIDGGIHLGNNKAIMNTYDDGGVVFNSGVSFSAQTNFYSSSENFNNIISYGSDTDDWGYDDLTPTLINSSTFGLSMISRRYTAMNYYMVNTIFVKSVEMVISYLFQEGEEMNTVSRNIKFDTGYKYFGQLDNLIYSKVNEKENMLKLKDTKEDKSVYPMIDEYGYDYDRRFIFKSSWDDDYYIRTKNEIE